METVLVPVDSHQFWLLEPDRRRGFPPRDTNGLIAVTGPGAAIIFTGISSGRVSVRAAALTAAPTAVDLDSWDEIADMSLPGPVGDLAVAALLDHVPPGLPALCAAGPGDYRVRVHARGRDISPDESITQPAEIYVILCWPASPAPAVDHKLTDHVGAGLRPASR
ncbi:hypothetical protein [Actinoplanes sp. M2I2]|uniref:hypothetical protein n=1 Tax=Actinoplanes sp. M2I2 TaxID=1734444 RepID=UPI002021F5FA|nr:hypothetical protein [Actinoplanes sp. M2I2]